MSQSSPKIKSLPLQLILSDDQLIALGQIAAQWAYLESEIAQHTDLTARIHGLPVPKEIDYVSFDHRITAWRTTVESIKVAERERATILRVINKISDMQHERHRTIHARWRLEKGGRLVAFNDRGRNVFEWNLSTEKLWKVVRKVSQLNAELGELQIPHPTDAPPSHRKPSKPGR